MRAYVKKIVKVDDGKYFIRTMDSDEYLLIHFLKFLLYLFIIWPFQFVIWWPCRIILFLAINAVIYLFKGIWFIICLPFKLIKRLFNKNKD